MQQRSGSTIKGVATITLMVCNVIFWCTLLFAVALLKAIIPIGAWRRWTSRGMTALAEAWIGTNNAIFRLMGSLPLDIHIREQADSGRPTVVADPDGAVAQVYRDIARKVAISVADKAADFSTKFPSIVIQNT